MTCSSLREYISFSSKNKYLCKNKSYNNYLKNVFYSFGNSALNYVERCSFNEYRKCVWKYVKKNYTSFLT